MESSSSAPRTPPSRHWGVPELPPPSMVRHPGTWHFKLAVSTLTESGCQCGTPTPRAAAACHYCHCQWHWHPCYCCFPTAPPQPSPCCRTIHFIACILYSPTWSLCSATLRPFSGPLFLQYSHAPSATRYTWQERGGGLAFPCVPSSVTDLGTCACCTLCYSQDTVHCCWSRACQCQWVGWPASLRKREKKRKRNSGLYKNRGTLGGKENSRGQWYRQAWEICLRLLIFGSQAPLAKRVALARQLALARSGR